MASSSSTNSFVKGSVHPASNGSGGARSMEEGSRQAWRESLRLGSDYLLSLQKPDGHWVGELEGDTILESEYALFLKFMGWLDDERLDQLAVYIERKQAPHGGWAIYPGGPLDVSASVKAYLVLRLAGREPGSAAMDRARRAILEAGGVPAANTFTKIYLAIFGLYPWDGTPVVPPELILLPKWSYLNIYEISAWSRTILIPLAILSALRPSSPLPVGIDELFPGPRSGRELRLKWENRFCWRNFFLTIDRLLHFCERHKIYPWRRQALARCEAWMLDRFPKSGGLGAIFPPMINALMALRCLGYADDSPEVQQQYRELRAFEIVEEGAMRMQPCVSPVWDTALCSMSLNAAGLPGDHPALLRAGEWLVERRIRERGDWAVKRPYAPVAAWYFEYENEFYPDVDDTIAVLMALKGTDLESEQPVRRLCRQAIDWVFAMQCRGGGWGSFDVDNDRALLTQVPFADHNAMIDPPTADITGRTLEMLGRYGYTLDEPRVRRAVEFIRQEQDEDGAWFGRWGVNYIYGAWQVLKGLAAVGEDMSLPYVARAAAWLKNHQNADGGWGETCESYADPALRGLGPSTASQTAWALMGLISAGAAGSDSVQRGIEYLTSTQNRDGSWAETEFTGTGFPKVFYLRYHLYCCYFPVFALGMYGQAVHAQPFEPAAARAAGS